MKIMYRDKDRDIGKVQMYTGASMWLNSYFVLATQPMYVFEPSPL